MITETSWLNRPHDWVLYTAFALYSTGVVFFMRTFFKQAFGYEVVTFGLPGMAILGLGACQLMPALRRRVSPFACGFVFLGALGMARFPALVVTNRGLPPWLP